MLQADSTELASALLLNKRFESSTLLLLQQENLETKLICNDIVIESTGKSPRINFHKKKRPLRVIFCSSHIYKHFIRALKDTMLKVEPINSDIVGTEPIKSLGISNQLEELTYCMVLQHTQ